VVGDDRNSLFIPFIALPKLQEALTICIAAGEEQLRREQEQHAGGSHAHAAPHQQPGHAPSFPQAPGPPLPVPLHMHMQRHPQAWLV
jgi:hypothetical protein